MNMPDDMKQKKKHHYMVLLHGKPYAETWAVSPQKAISNAWWKYEKCEDVYNGRYDYTVDDFDAVEI